MTTSLNLVVVLEQLANKKHVKRPMMETLDDLLTTVSRPEVVGQR
jgi:hypothetical protein